MLLTGGLLMSGLCLDVLPQCGGVSCFQLIHRVPGFVPITPQSCEPFIVTGGLSYQLANFQVSGNQPAPGGFQFQCDLGAERD
jgi:hypothetical protein